MEIKSLLRESFDQKLLVGFTFMPLVFVRFLREDCLKERGMERRREKPEALRSTRTCFESTFLLLSAASFIVMPWCASFRMQQKH